MPAGTVYQLVRVFSVREDELEGGRIRVEGGELTSLGRADDRAVGLETDMELIITLLSHAHLVLDACRSRTSSSLMGQSGPGLELQQKAASNASS